MIFRQVSGNAKEPFETASSKNDRILVVTFNSRSLKYSFGIVSFFQLVESPTYGKNTFETVSSENDRIYLEYFNFAELDII